MIEDTLKEAEDKMAKAVVAAKEDFATIRTGRAEPAVFGKLTIEYYGTPTPLVQLASFQTPDAHMLIVTPFDKTAMPAMEKAIRESDFGVNPTNDGSVIRVSFPALTQERRKEFVKLAKSKSEDSKVSIRNVRRHAKESLEKLQKDGQIGEDELHRSEKQLEDITAKHTASVDDLLKRKETELLSL